MRLKATGTDLTELHNALLESAPDEGAAFLSIEPSGSSWLLHSFRVFSPDDLEAGPTGELAIREDVQLTALGEIKKSGHLLVEVHTHPFSTRRVQFSHFDDEQLPIFCRYVKNKLRTDLFGALVFGQKSADGRCWVGSREERLELEPVGPVSTIPDWLEQPTSYQAPGERFDRQVRALGPVGQARLAKLKVGIVGLGGTGSQIVQQLAHLGVRDYVLVEDDKVEESNLPRLAGASISDVALKRSKSSVAKRMIVGLCPEASISCTGALRTEASLAQLSDVDVVIGCVDNDGARLVLAELASANLVPYLDIGVGIEGEGEMAAAGGRIVFQLPKGACVACADEIDFREAAEDLDAEELRAIRLTRGYATDRRIEPAIMPLNTTLVGLASMELLAFVTGFRSVIPFWRYDAFSQSLRKINVPVNEDCPICRPAMAMGERQLISRYALTGPVRSVGT